MVVRVTSVSSSPSAPGTLKLGQTVTFTLGVNQPVTVTGIPTLLLNDGGVAFYTAALSNSPGILVFQYLVGPGQATSDLSVLGMTTNGGAISAIGSLSFDTPTNFDTGGQPVSVATGDFDGDGKPDLVVANYADDTVSVLLNASNGSVLTGLGFDTIKFAGATTYQVGSHPSAVAIGDVNGDGKPDIVVTNASDDTVTILRGETDGTFELLRTDDTGLSPVAVATGLLNDDTKLDLAVATASKSVSVLLNTGAGHLDDRTAYSAGSAPSAVAVADIDGDGDPDLFITNERSNTVSVLLNDGSGEFGHGVTLHVGSAPAGVLAIDVNNDGEVDLVTANSGDGTVSVLLGDGNGGFGEAHSFIAGNGPVAIAAGDMDGDRKIDLVVANDDGKVSTLLGNGDGTFNLPFSVATGSHPTAVNVADYNGDGLLDVAVTNSGDDNVTLLKNNSLLPGDLATASILLNLGIDTHIVVDAAPPTVLNRTANPGTGSFGAGRSISITLTFSEPVAVAGVPALTLNDGGTALYVSGSGTASLVFTTNVAAGQNAANLSVTAVSLPPGATITDVTGNNAVLTRALTTFAGLRIDTTAPTIAADLATPGTGKFGAGQVITLTLTGSENLTVSGTPALVLNNGGAASYLSGSGTASLVFRYTIAFGQDTTNLAVTGVTLPGGATIRDAAGNNAVLTGAVASFTDLVIDTTAPVVSAVTASPGTGNIEVGHTITFTLTFSEAVDVTGAVALTLNDGGTASYVSGSGTASLVFSATVEAGQNAASLGVTGVTLPPGASVTGVSGGTNAYLAGAVKTFASITVDTSGPTVRSLTTTPSDTSLSAGAVVTLNLLLSKIVSVTGGIPTLTLNDGAVARYVSGSGTNMLVFATTVVPGQATPDLAVTALDLNGAVVADSQGRAADLTGAVTNPAGTLAISAAAVTVTDITATPSAAGPLGVGRSVTFAVTLDDTVTVVGTPLLTLNDGGTASYDADASTATELVFHTIVAAGQNAANLTVTALSLNGAVVTVPDRPLSFTPPANHVTGAYSRYVTIGDVNEDGQPDLLVSYGVGLSILLGDGNGGFFPATNFAIGRATTVTLADMNHDNHPDLAIADASNGVAVALGDGTGNFGTPTAYTGSLPTQLNGIRPINPYSLAMGDMNGDGTPDVVVGDQENRIFVMLGDGAGGLGAPLQTGLVAAYNYQNLVALTDVNGDGKLDAVVADNNSDVFVMLGDGHGGLGSATFLAISPDRYGLVGLVVTDLNGDGRSDIATSYLYGGISVWLADGSGGFGAPTDFITGVEPYGLAVADVNGDGKPDLIDNNVSDVDHGGVDVLLGDGLGGFGAPTRFDVSYYPSALAVGDVDNDGRPDIVVTRDVLVTGTEIDQREGTVSVLLNTTIAPNVFDPAGAATATGGATGIVVDTTPPIIAGATTAPARGAYDVGRTIDITLDSNEALAVTGAPVLMLNDGGTAVYVGGSGTTSLLFRTTVAAGQNVAALAVTGVTLPIGTTIRDAAGNDADLTGAAASFPGLAIVTTFPTVQSVVASPVDATLGAGAVVTLRILLSKPVSVSRGVPTLTLNDGAIASYVSGSGTNTLVFSATVATGQAASDLAVTAVNLNGAVVADRGGQAADLTGAVVNPAGILAVSTPPVTITAITATPSAVGPLGLGQTVTFTATIGRAVTVAGVPSLMLNDGAAASYDAAASSPTSLVFRTTIAAGQYTPNLAVTSLSLNGATIAVPGTLAFAAAAGHATGSQPSGATVADVNGDGTADLVVTNAGDGTVTVLLGTGAGDFAPPVAYAAGAGPVSVAVADVNLDGRPDLIVAGGGAVSSGAVSVLLGTGAGGFAAAASIPVNGGISVPQTVTVADVNEDGNPDLVVATGISVALMLGDGVGGFSAGGIYAPGFYVMGATVADVNGDGRLDLIAIDTGDNDFNLNPAGTKGVVSVLLGNGGFGFGTPASYTVDFTPTAVTAADVNGDGTPDLLVLNAQSGDVSVLAGNGFGGFQTAVNYAAGVAPSAIAAADLNGDGKLDLAVGDAGKVSVLLGNGTGGFALPTSFAAGNTVITSLSAADVNGDGRPDLVATSGSGSVFVLLNQSGAPGSFTADGAAALPGASTGIVVDTTVPVIFGTVAGQGVADDRTVRPFASVQVLHARPAASEAVTITVTSGGVASDANGMLAGAGLTRTGAGTYTLAAGSPDAVTAALRLLVFTPAANQVTPGASVTTGFTLSVNGGVQPVIDATTTVTAVSVNDAPTIGGTAANQSTSHAAPVNPFSAVTIGDADAGQTETAIVTFAAANGSVSNGTGTVAPGRYTASGTAGQVQAALRGLVFTPAAGSAPGQTVMTGLNLTIDDGFTTTLDQTTSVAVNAVACFATGTRILTPSGEIAVEDLAEGDAIVSASGDTVKVTWIGHRRVDCRRHPKPREVWPVRILAGAFGRGLPCRELWLSPDHAVFVDDVLIPIRYLVNGATIAQVPVDAVTYWHVELPRHDILLAEGLPAESYLDTGNRCAFANGGAATMLHADFALRIWAAQACAKLVLEGPRVTAVRRRLRRRAAALGFAVAGEPDLALRAGDARIAPRLQAGGLYRFAVPAGATELWLMSRSAVPSEIGVTARDHRRLGVMIERIILRRAGWREDIPLDALPAGEGLHPLESHGARSWRWTDGGARLALPAGLARDGGLLLDLHIAAAQESWVQAGRRKRAGRAA